MRNPTARARPPAPASCRPRSARGAAGGDYGLRLSRSLRPPRGPPRLRRRGGVRQRDAPDPKANSCARSARTARPSAGRPGGGITGPRAPAPPHGLPSRACLRGRGLRQARGLRLRGPRLGPRSRDEPVRGRGIRDHGWTYAKSSAYYYPGTRSLAAGPRRARAARRTGAARGGLVDEALPGREPEAAAAPLPGRYGLGPALALRRGQAARAPPPPRFGPARRRSRSTARAYRGDSRLPVGRRLGRRRPGLAGGVPPRGRALGDAVLLAASSAAGPGDRGALLRGRDAAPDQSFDASPDTRDQVYGGIAAERPATDAAVAATAALS